MSWPKPTHKIGPSGIEFYMNMSNDLGDGRITLCAMGCVKPANDIEEFYREKRSRELLANYALTMNGLLRVKAMMRNANPQSTDVTEDPPPPTPPQ